MSPSFSSIFDAVDTMLDAINAMRDELDSLYPATDSVSDELSSWIFHAEDHLAEASGGLERALRFLKSASDK